MRNRKRSGQRNAERIRHRVENQNRSDITIDIRFDMFNVTRCKSAFLFKNIDRRRRKAVKRRFRERAERGTAQAEYNGD